MDQIPQEIYDRIDMYIVGGEVPVESVPPAERSFNRQALAPISRKWQHTVERRHFRNLKLKSTELDDFERIMVGARRRYLRVLRYYIVLPAYPVGSRLLFERQVDRQANDEAFTASIYGLFRILKSWEYENNNQPAYSVHLSIRHIFSPTDYRFRSRSYVPTEEEKLTQYGHFGMRYRYSYIRLLSPAELPTINGIEELDLYWQKPHRRKLTPETYIEIAAKLSNLRSMRGQLEDSESRYPALRRRYRNGLIHAIDSLKFPASIKHLSFRMHHLMHYNQAWQPTNLLIPGSNSDPLSSAVWKATCHLSSLTTLHIEGVVDASLMWPAQGSVGRTEAPKPRSTVPVEPFWQNITSLDIEFSMASPSGQWYFCAPESERRIVLGNSVTNKAVSDTDLPPGYSSSEQEDIDASVRYRYIHELQFSGRDAAVIFRLVPDEPVLVPLIESFSRACAQIPNLAEAKLSTVLREAIEVDGKTSTVSSGWGIYFATPGNQSGWYPSPKEQGYPGEDLTVPRLTLNTRNWRPDEDLRKLLRGIGGHEESLDETYVDLWEMVEKPQEVEALRKREQ